jgi:putative FmdB family regulatory protein
MPLYEFECVNPDCQARFETIDRIENCPKKLPCPDCGGQAKKIISSRGAVHGDTPNWLEDKMVQGALGDIDSTHFKPIESRGQLKQIMKERGICEAPKAGPRWV